MSVYIRHMSLSCAFFCLFLTSGLNGQEPNAPSDAQTAEASPESPQANAIRAILQEYVRCFNAREFEKMNQLLSSNFAYNDISGEESAIDAKTMIGRITATVEQYPSLTLSSQLSSLDVDNETAEASGLALLNFGQDEWEESRFVLKLTGADADWKISSIEETLLERSGSATVSRALRSLQWLVGEWRDTENQAVVSIIERMPGQPFLRRSFTREVDGQIESLGFEVIGYDPHLQLVRSWTFFADGSFGTATWHGGSDHWQIRRKQTLSDGSVASGTYTITPKDENSMSVKLISREVDGEPQPSGTSVMMSRVVATQAIEVHEPDSEAQK